MRDREQDPGTKAAAAAAGDAPRRAGADPAVVATLIIPMLNERRRLRACLGSILAQDYPLDRIEILLLDGMSTDGTREIAREMIEAHPSVSIELVDNPRRIPAAAMNIGIR